MIRLRDLPPDIRDYVSRERRDARAAAKAFHTAVAGGDADAVENAISRLHETGGWQIALRRIAGLPRASEAVRWRFLMIWVESAHLQNRADRRTMANALRVLTAGYFGPSLTLYRGALMRERRSHCYKFAWTTDIRAARDFARGKANISSEACLAGLKADDAVVLETVAPPEAILHQRGNEMTFYGARDQPVFNESEVIVDPFGLGRVRLVERIRAGSRTSVDA
jgi:hypothetical protein